MCAKEYGVENCATPGNIDLINERTLAMDAFQAEMSNEIAPLKNLKNTKVWIFSGTLDSTVYHTIVNITNDFYKLMGTRDLTYVNDVASTHSFPSTDPYSPVTCLSNNF